MKNITNSMWNKIEHNGKNSYYKIGFYNKERNCFEEVARWRNAYNSNSGANYGLLQMWTRTFSVNLFESQGGRNTCGGYNKPIANLEGCLYQFQKAIENKEIVTDGGEFEFSYCGSIESLLSGLMAYIQKQYIMPLFLMDCNG